MRMTVCKRPWFPGCGGLGNDTGCCEAGCIVCDGLRGAAGECVLWAAHPYCSWVDWSQSTGRQFEPVECDVDRGPEVAMF
jgi:hypothetical protein